MELVGPWARGPVGRSVVLQPPIWLRGARGPVGPWARGPVGGSAAPDLVAWSSWARGPVGRSVLPQPRIWLRGARGPVGPWARGPVGPEWEKIFSGCAGFVL